MNRLIIKVSGTTFNGRQELIPHLVWSDPVRFEPEPENPYDPNAIKVLIAHEGNVWHMGYVPKEMAAQIAPSLEGEPLMGHIHDFTGGFIMPDGSRANYGLLVFVDLPEVLS